MLSLRRVLSVFNPQGFSTIQLITWMNSPQDLPLPQSKNSCTLFSCFQIAQISAMTWFIFCLKKVIVSHNPLWAHQSSWFRRKRWNVMWMNFEKKVSWARKLGTPRNMWSWASDLVPRDCSASEWLIFINYPTCASSCFVWRWVIYPNHLWHFLHLYT